MVTDASVQNRVQTSSVQQETGVSLLPEQEAADTDGGQAKKEPVMLQQYAGLYEENQDLVGWLSIEGMKIDYPVMQNEDDG